MQAIKHALTERWYAWEDARKVAMSDNTVEMQEEDPGVSDQVETGSNATC